MGYLMKSTGEAIHFIKDQKEEPALRGDAGFFHCEAQLCGPWQMQVCGERSMYLSR